MNSPFEKEEDKMFVSTLRKMEEMVRPFRKKLMKKMETITNSVYLPGEKSNSETDERIVSQALSELLCSECLKLFIDD